MAEYGYELPDHLCPSKAYLEWVLGSFGKSFYAESWTTVTSKAQEEGNSLPVPDFDWDQSGRGTIKMKAQ